MAAAEPKPTAQRNFTDPDARIMKTAGRPVAVRVFAGNTADPVSAYSLISRTRYSLTP